MGATGSVPQTTDVGRARAVAGAVADSVRSRASLRGARAAPRDSIDLGVAAVWRLRRAVLRPITIRTVLGRVRPGTTFVPTPSTLVAELVRARTAPGPAGDAHRCGVGRGAGREIRERQIGRRAASTERAPVVRRVRRGSGRCGAVVGHGALQPHARTRWDREQQRQQDQSSSELHDTPGNG